MKVTTFAVLPSWMYLLGGDDNCMLSVPSGACDLHICSWQSGEICQAITTAAFTLFIYALWSSSNYGCSPFVRSCSLANVLLASRFPSSRPDTVSFRSCLFLPRGFLGTREAGTCAGSRACFPFSFFSIFLLLLIFARSFRQPREMSLHALWKCNGPTNT